jgi:2-dehydro-3-deoxyphosphooctonate aldolase (KDO 8-P synthase)
MIRLFSPAPVLIAGPCVLEGDAVNLAVADRLAELAATLGLRVVYKGSFDKANRTRADAPRGPGLERGLELLASVRDASGLSVLTDIHEPAQAAVAAQVVDALQIPAFLCRQTDLLEAAGGTGLPVNIKKGQWADVGTMASAVEKLGGADIAVTERGTFFGYGDLVVDMRAFGALKGATGAAVLFDATHSAQRPGRASDSATGGSREHVPALIKAAAAAGADGFFIETHPESDLAPSDAATMWPLADLESLVEQALEVWHAARGSGSRTART